MSKQLYLNDRGRKAFQALKSALTGAAWKKLRFFPAPVMDDNAFFVEGLEGTDIGNGAASLQAVGFRLVSTLPGRFGCRDDYTDFGDIAYDRCGMQCQYASRYIDGRIEGYPNLGDGLRFTGDPRDYHSVRIHRDDVETFVTRLTEYRARNGF